MSLLKTMRGVATVAALVSVTVGAARADGDICKSLQSDAASVSGTPSTVEYTPDSRFHMGDRCDVKGPVADVRVLYHRSANATTAKQLLEMNRMGMSSVSGKTRDLTGLGDAAFSTGGGSVSFLTGTIYVNVMEFVHHQAPDVARDQRQTERVARAIAKHIQRDLH